MVMSQSIQWEYWFVSLDLRNSGDIYLRIHWIHTVFCLLASIFLSQEVSFWQLCVLSTGFRAHFRQNAHHQNIRMEFSTRVQDCIYMKQHSSSPRKGGIDISLQVRCRSSLKRFFFAIFFHFSRRWPHGSTTYLPHVPHVTYPRVPISSCLPKTLWFIDITVRTGTEKNDVASVDIYNIYLMGITHCR